MVSTSSLAALGWPPTIEPETFHSETSFMSNTIVAETSDEEEYFFPAREDTSASNPDRYLKQKISTHGKLAYVVYSGCSAGGVFYNWYVHIISSNLFANLKLSSQDCSRASHFWARIFKQDLQRIFFLRSCPFCLGWVYKHWLPPIWCCYELRYKAVPYSSKPFGTSCFCFTQYPTTFLYLFQMPLTPRGTHTVIPAASPTARSTQGPSTSTSTQGRNAVALAIAREEAFRADQEDFWVVFTGTAPGVHQGR